jgi:hypothetical protein
MYCIILVFYSIKRQPSLWNRVLFDGKQEWTGINKQNFPCKRQLCKGYILLQKGLLWVIGWSSTLINKQWTQSRLLNSNVK